MLPVPGPAAVVVEIGEKVRVDMKEKQMGRRASFMALFEVCA